ncbi:MAG: hypothetical protein JXB07_18865 [Anaerolineae bacterium]|nr:hypothetical protein [Anaerolineae bacterium]
MPARQFDLRIRVKAKDEASGVLGAIGGGLQKLGTIAIAGIGAVGAGVAYIASQAIPAASDLNESLNASSVVFGEAAGIIQDFGKTSAEAVGMSESAFNQLAAQTGSMLQNYGLDANEAANATIDLGKRAADMASIFNTDVSDAMTAINAAMRGEADPIERFGVSMSMAKVEAQALAMGFEKVDGQFEQAALTQARLALLMDQTSTIAGDFSNTSDQLANATRINEARWANFMGTLGKLGLPIMTTMQGILMDVGDWALPLVEGAIDDLLPKVESIAGGISTFVGALLSGQPPIDAFTTMLSDIGLDGLASTIESIMPGIDAFIAKAGEILGPIIGWVQNNVSLNDILVGLGVAIGTVVIPAIISVISTIAPIIAIFAAVVLAVSLLRNAWENDFLGLRTIFENVWNNGIVPAFEYVKAELLPRVMEVFDRLSVIWENKILPQLARLGINLDGSLGPIIEQVLIIGIGEAVKALEILIDAIDWMIPLVDRWASGIKSIVNLFLWWRNGIQDVVRAIANLKLPVWLTPGSPTPFETGLWGINDAMDEMARKQLPSLSRGLGITNPLQPAVAGAGAAGGAGGGEIIRLEVPVILNGREVGYGAVEGTLDAFRQRGVTLNSGVD